jgi:hypothetical protein
MTPPPESPAERLRAIHEHVTALQKCVDDQRDSGSTWMAYTTTDQRVIIEDIAYLLAEVTRLTQQREEADDLDVVIGRVARAGHAVLRLDYFERLQAALGATDGDDLPDSAQRITARAEAAEAALHSATRAVLLQAAEDSRAEAAEYEARGLWIRRDEAVRRADWLTARAKESGA